jgi:hypothetical protein
MDFASRWNRRMPVVALMSVLATGVSGCAKSRPAGGGADREAAAKAVLATIDGRVVAASGLAIADATIVLDGDGDTGERGLDRTPMATVRSAADGGFHIANVPAGRYRLRAHAAEYADGHMRVEVHPRERLTTVVRLAQAETLKGQVVDRKGQPIPGARVLLWYLADPSGRPREGTSDEAGRFILGGLNRGLHRLIAEAPGFGSVELSPIEIPAAAPVLRMQTDGHSVVGTVTSGGGAPAVGARVVIGGENLNPIRETTAGIDGHFLFSGIGAGAYVLRASRLGEVSRVSSEIIVERSSDRPAPVALVLGPGWTIAGRVLDDAGRPLPDAEVRIDALPGEDPLPDMIRPDARGNWRAGPLLAGEYRLTPRQPGFVARRAVHLMVGASTVGGDRPQILELVRGGDIVGRVVDSAGAPVRDATVRCLVPGREDLSVIVDRLPLAAEAAALPSGSGHALGRTRSVASDSRGGFQLADILPGSVIIEVDRGGSVPRRSPLMALQPGQRLDVGTISIQDGVRLAGRITDDSGDPLDGARVVVGAGAASTKAESDVVVMTDRGGQFVTSVSEGVHQLRVSAPGMQDHSVTVRAVAGVPQDPQDLVVRLGRADGALDGSVHDGLGRPLVRARVIAWPAPLPSSAAASSGALPAIADGVAPLASTTTDAGGHFALSRLPRAMILIEVTHPSYPRVAELVDVTPPPRPALAIKVPIPGGIEGEVRERVTGATVSTYRIEARGPEGRIASATRKSAGFLLPRLFPGRWTLSVRAPGYIAAETTVDVPATSNLGEASAKGVRVEISPEPRN